MAVQFRLLGDITVEHHGHPVDIGYAQLRAVLAALLVDANRLVPVDQLVDAVWGTGKLPRNPRAGIQHSVTLLRTVLKPMVGVTIVWRTPGYQLTADPATIDLHEFHRLSNTARAEADIGLFTQALQLWRGEPFTGLDTPWFAAQRSVLTQQHHAAQHNLLDLRLAHGDHTAVLSDLIALTQQQPLDERLAGQLMLALYRSGRPADALTHYHHLRTQLAEELGTDPTPPLQQLHHRILTTDPTLTAPTPEPTPPTVPRQLPAPPHQFTGRGTELAILDKQTGTAGAVVISAIGGTGGIGKTWLALHWAHQHLDRFPDGQLHVNLCGFDPVDRPLAPAAALYGLLSALGVAPGTIPADLDSRTGLYRSLVADKRLLIMLDNAHDTDQVTPLLPGSPTCTVLVTSRHHLGGLIATQGAGILDLDVLPEPDARDLLASRLGHDRTTAEPQAVTDLIAYCAGLPLALGIVAARAALHPTFPLAVLADELRDATTRLDGLDTGELRGNLRAVLSWSTQALGPQATNLFGLLGFAPGPDISLPAAASLAGLPPARTRAVLRELEHASLLVQHVPGRYRMHDLIRLYATDAGHHHTDDQRDAALRRVLDFYIHTADLAERVLAPQRLPIQLDTPAVGACPLALPDAPEAVLAWLEAEHGNLLAAQRLAADHGWHRAVWQIAWALDTFHYWQGHRHIQVATWQAALDAAIHLPDVAARTTAYRRLGHAYADLGDHRIAIEHLYRSLALADQHDDPLEQARAHRMLTVVWGLQGNANNALAHANRNLRLSRALNQPRRQADAYNVLGWSSARLGRYAAGYAHCQAALTLYREHPDPDGQADTLDSLGYIAHQTGRDHDALGYYQQAVAMFRACGNTYQLANSLNNLGQVLAGLGERQQARSVWDEAVRLFQQRGRRDDAERVRRRLATLDTAGPTARGQAARQAAPADRHTAR
jgi:DNA-binding SARP family transcriptional activator/tetratricopeptide (TPR) repeat protein